MDDRVVALSVTWRSPGEKGVLALSIGYVAVVEAGRLVRGELYDPGDRQAMVARYAALGGGQSELGDRPPERLWAEFSRRLADCDVDRIVDLFADDHVMVDERIPGWEGLGKAEVRPVLESMFDSASFWRLEVAEVLACDDRVIALLVNYHGQDGEGGRFRVSYGFVSVVTDGLQSRTERFGGAARQQILARFTELGGGLGALGVRPPERFWSSYARRFAAGDLEGVTDLCADDLVVIDHRVLGSASLSKADVRQVLGSLFAEVTGYWLEVEEVLACDDRVIALLATFHGCRIDGCGRLGVRYGVVGVISDGLLCRSERYETGDRQAILTRFAELAGRALGDRPPGRLWKDLTSRFSARDLDGLAELHADDWRLVDHRMVGWGEIAGREQGRELLSSMLDMTPDGRLEFIELLGCDDRVIAFTACWRGSGTGGIGEVELPVGIVSVVESGRMSRQDMYEPDQLGAILARYAELTGT